MEVYLDHAATSHPKPPAVVEAVVAALTEYNANPGRSGHRRALNAARVVLGCREGLANLLQVDDPFRFVFGLNCTEALNLAIKGVLHRGDHVISTLLEHNSVLRVLSHLKATGQIELTLLTPEPNGMIDPDAVRLAIKRNTRLIALTHASNVTGVIQPVAAVGQLAREQGITYLVDGAQAAGIIPVDIQAIAADLYAFPGHKGLLGPQGTGALYIAPRLSLNPLKEGGTGSSSDSMRQPDELPERYESGTVNLHGLAGLLKGTEYVSENLTRLREEERKLSEHLAEGLRDIGRTTLYSPIQGFDRVGVVSFNVADLSSSAVADQLDRMGFCVRGGLHCAPGAHHILNTTKRGAVRASVGYMNTHAEIDAFIDAVHQISRNGIGG